MQRIFVLLTALALAWAPVGHARAWIAQGGTAVVHVQHLLFHSGVTLSAAADRYLPFGYGTAVTASSTYFKSMKFPVSGKLTQIIAYAVTAPASGKSWQVAVYLNNGLTAAKCTITGPAQSCTATFSVTVSANDDAAIQTHPSGTPTATIITADISFQPDNPGDSIIVGQGLNFSNAAVNAAYPYVNANAGTVASRRSSPLPAQGTIDHLYVESNAPGTVGSASKYDYTIGKNGSAGAVTCPISETAITCNDTTNTVSISAPTSTTADDIALQGSPTNTPTSATAAFGFRFRTTTPNGYPLMSPGQTLADSASNITYYPLSAGSGGGSTTQGNAESIVAAQTIIAMVVKLSTSPGSGKSRTFTLLRNSNPTACAITFSNLETLKYITCSSPVALNDNDKVTTKDDPTGGASPAAENPAIVYLATSP